ncbi:MAG: response regulator [Anaerolineales bacterium]|nr:response regulator [Anaerolineales bacterium]
MLNTLSFLYVEDDPNSRKVMDLIMNKAMQVKSLVIFEDSKDFQTRLENLSPRPDIILLDIHVEPLDGFEMLKIIRQSANLHGVKVIALTASVMNEEIEKLRTEGFDGTVSKPLSLPILPGLFERIANGESVWHIV